MGKVRAFLLNLLRHVPAPFKRAALLRKDRLSIHLGCGNDRCQGFINVDQRFTSATDVTMDCSRPRFRPGSVRVCYSHAFFEHLFRRDQIPHLEALHAALEAGGVICYLGLPDFANISRFYRERRPGIVGPVFDLFNVYRYTHGDPESVGWYLAQLHKSLFDYAEVVRLLTMAGFRHFVVLSYCYGNEPLPVNLGFYATKGELVPGRDLFGDCLTFLRQVAGAKVNLATVCFLEKNRTIQVKIQELAGSGKTL